MLKSQLTKDNVFVALKEIAAPGIVLGLERVQNILRLFGRPQSRYISVLIGGTNGKGSVAAMLTAIAHSAGLHVGTFTSPHLIMPTERFLLSGQPVSLDCFYRLVYEHWNTLRELAVTQELTEFELHCALALQLFAQQKVDLAILEVGLGGRLDATNVVNPLVSVITNVSYDHQEVLGDSLRDIAWEKAGIIKEHTPVITAAKGEALAVICEVSRLKNAPLVEIGKDVTATPVTADLRRQDFTVKGLKHNYSVSIPLLGSHQRKNALCALASAEVIAKILPNITSKYIVKGLSQVCWPGRFEVLPGSPTLVLDAAHNPAAAVALRETLEALFPGRELVLVLGILADKDREEVLRILGPIAKALVVTKPPQVRAGKWEQVGEIGRKYCRKVHLVADPLSALEMGVELSAHNGVVVITGSIYTISTLRAFIMQSWGRG